MRGVSLTTPPSPTRSPGWSKKHDEEVPQADIIKYNPDMIGPIPGTGADEDGGPGSLISAKKRKQDPSNTAVEVAVEVRCGSSFVCLCARARTCARASDGPASCRPFV